MIKFTGSAILDAAYYVKIICIRSFSGPYFPVFRLNTHQKNGHFSSIGTENTDTFHAVAEFIKLKRLAYKNYLT